jgi:cytochrome c-type biogenesis protein CcmF
MVGREIEETEIGNNRKAGAIVLEVEQLSLPWSGHARQWRLHDISFHLKQGEVLGIAGLMAWHVEDIRVAKLNEPFTVGAYELELTGVNRVQGPNYFSTMGDVILRTEGKEIALMHPEKRNYPVAQMPTTEAAIDYRFLRDVYVVIGDPQKGGGWTLRTYIKPLANWVWGGVLLMAFGGMLSLSDRRFRIAAGESKRRQRTVPAE